MKTLKAIAHFLVAAAALSPIGMFGQYTEGIINFPGEFGATFPGGIDSLDQIDGFFFDATGTHGFVLSRGVFAQVIQPPGVQVKLLGINSVAGVVGFTTGSGFSGDHAFFDGQRTLRSPASGAGRHITGINASGTFVGFDNNGGFIGYKNTYTSVIPTVCSGYPGIVVNGIAANGDYVGYCTNIYSDTVAFANIGGVDQAITCDGPRTYATGINDSGVIAGYFLDPSGFGMHGFTYSGGTCTQFDYASGFAPYSDTKISGINNKGSLVGTVFDASQSQVLGFYHIPN